MASALLEFDLAIAQNRGPRALTISDILPNYCLMP